jgi:hypothetical protein
MRVTFKASPDLLRIGEIGESIVDADEDVRKQISNFVLGAIRNGTIPLRTNSGLKVSPDGLEYVKRAARLTAKHKAEKRAAKPSWVDLEMKFLRAAKARYIESEGPMLGIASGLKIRMYDAQILDLAQEQECLSEGERERQAGDERIEQNKTYRNQFARLSEVAEWLRNEHGFDVRIAASGTTHDPKQAAEELVGWYDGALDAMTWWGLGSVTPREAAMLLCRFNPHDDKLDPLVITTDETAPDDFKRLLRVFEDVEQGQPQARTLIDWHNVARNRQLKYHSWIDVFRQAVVEIPQTSDASPVPAEQPALSGNGRSGAPTLLSDGEGEQVALPPTTTVQEQSKNSEPKEVLRKRQAFIDAFQSVWPSIERDLRDSSRNGLSEAAKHRKHGFWCVKPALDWADQRGKIERDRAEAFVRAEGQSELSVLVRAMLDRK